MAVLRDVIIWPTTGDPVSTWAVPDFGPDPFGPAEDSAYDSFARIMRRTSEAFGPALAAQRIANPTSEIRLIFRGLAEGEAIVTPVDWKATPGHFEMVDVLLPRLFPLADGDARARTALAVSGAAVKAVGSTRGWSSEVVDSAMQVTVENGIKASYCSPWKHSPNRKWLARLSAEIRDDGCSWAHLQVASKDESDLMQSPPEMTWGNTLSAAKRMARSLRWVSASRVEFAPLGHGSWVRLGVDRSGRSVDRHECLNESWRAPAATIHTPFPVVIGRD